MTNPAQPRVCSLGPEATFSHAACLRHFGDRFDWIPAQSIPIVFRTVATGKADFGVVPVENSIEGSVGVTLDGFADSPCRICAEVCLPIDHCLLSRSEDFSLIREVYSHPQALAQCRDWLARNLPHAGMVPSPSTATAAEEAARKPHCAAVGGAMLAARHNLHCLAEHIQDRPINLTRFWVLHVGPSPAPSGRDRTSLMIGLAHQPGALYEGLRHFAAAKVNLTHIESRPCPDTPFRYKFFLDMDGHADTPPLSAALTEVQSATHAVTVLGSYPRDNSDAGGQRHDATRS